MFLSSFSPHKPELPQYPPRLFFSTSLFSKLIRRSLHPDETAVGEDVGEISKPVVGLFVGMLAFDVELQLRKVFENPNRTFLPLSPPWTSSSTSNEEKS
eukprot:snap_masked-scaffold_106-processed-gene-0.12-mRNA-1 protein AED:1.00 eAED:1.00 QI:0/-1/0/0/-1/1/1/0/98